jgi:HAD superfamily hydrolase (TIGR01509 family)
MTIKAILWDNDGVLVDTEHLFFCASRETLARIGIELTQQIYVEFVLKQSKGIWHLAAEKGIPEPEIVRLRAERDALYSQLLREGRTVIDGAEETLDRLYGRFTMGIVTSSRRDHFEIIHQSTNLLRYFDFVVASGDYTRYKPDPEPYLIAIERTGLAKDACIAVEDSERGLTAAIRAGIRCLVVPNGMTKDGDFSGAYKVLNDVRQVVTEVLLLS